MTLTKLFKGFVRYLLKRFSLITYIACFMNLKRVILFKGSLQSWFLKNSFHFFGIIHQNLEGEKWGKTVARHCQIDMAETETAISNWFFVTFFDINVLMVPIFLKWGKQKVWIDDIKPISRNVLFSKKNCSLKIVKTTIEKFNFETKPSSELVM